MEDGDATTVIPRVDDIYHSSKIDFSSLRFSAYVIFTLRPTRDIHAVVYRRSPHTSILQPAALISRDGAKRLPDIIAYLMARVGQAD